MLLALDQNSFCSNYLGTRMLTQYNVSKLCHNGLAFQQVHAIGDFMCG